LKFIRSLRFSIDPVQFILLLSCLVVGIAFTFSCGPKHTIEPSSGYKAPPNAREQWRNAILGIQDGAKVLNGICLKEVKRLHTSSAGAPSDTATAVESTKAGKLAKTCADAFDATMASLYSGALMVDAFDFQKVGALACAVSRASTALHTLASAVVTVVGDAAKLPAVAIDGLKTADDFSAFIGGGCTDGK